jgi:predicted nuclease with RNAse H fold
MTIHALGIDLAAQPEKTAVCRVYWHGDGAPASIETPTVGWTDHRLLELMTDADAIAIDAPFGWPQFMNLHLGEYARSGVWPLRPDGEDAKDWILRLRYRETDRAVRRLLLKRSPPAKLWPLSVSSNLIAVCAWRCAALLHQHAQILSNTFDRTGHGNGVYEAYPAAALAAWGMPFKGYKPGSAGSTKSTTAETVRGDIADGLQAKSGGWLRIDAHDGLREQLVNSDNADDKLDALISALVARAAHARKTVQPEAGSEEERLAPEEGWIHVPEFGSLAELG